MYQKDALCIKQHFFGYFLFKCSYFFDFVGVDVEGDFGELCLIDGRSKGQFDLIVTHVILFINYQCSVCLIVKLDI